MGYKIVVYIKNNQINIFENIVINGVDIPQTIPAVMSSFKEGFKYKIEVDENFTRVEDIIEEYDPVMWMSDIIQEINKLNSSGLIVKKRQKISLPDDYFMDETMWELIVSTLQLGNYILLTGPTGCGKTQLVQSLAKYLDYDFYYINCGGMIKPKQTLVGSVQAQNGSTFLVESEFLTYFKSEKPTIILLDEFSRMPGQAANTMMTILDKIQGYVYVEELAKRIYKGEKVIFIATANFGLQYVDTRKMDVALLDRFIPFHLNYLSESEEIKLINSRIDGLDQTSLIKLVKTINMLRDNYEDLNQEISHRRSIDLAKYLTLNFSTQEIIDNILVNLFVNGNDDRRAQVEQILNARLV